MCYRYSADGHISQQPNKFTKIYLLVNKRPLGRWFKLVCSVWPERSRRNLCAGYSGPFCEWKSSVSWVRTCDKVAASTTDLCSQTRLEEKLIDGKLFKPLRIKWASFTHSFNQVSTVHFPLSTAHLWQCEGSEILVGTPRRAAVVASGDYSGRRREVTSTWSWCLWDSSTQRGTVLSRMVLGILAGTCAQPLSCVGHFATSWTVAHQAPLSVEFSRRENWIGLPFPPPGDFSQPRDQTCVSYFSCIGRQILYQWATWEAQAFSLLGSVC